MHVEASLAAPRAPAALVRDVRRWDTVALMVNSIVGAGIFGLPSRAYALVGTWSLLAFLACAAVVALLALCYAEVASRFTGTGGPYLYARSAFGARAGFAIGWLAWLARLASMAFICNVMVSYLAYFWPPAASGLGRALVMTGLVGALTAVNVRGVGRGALASDAFAIAKLTPMFVFVGVGLFFVAPARYALPEVPAAGAFPLTVAQLFVSFTGFELGSIAGGEVRDPQRTMPFAILTALSVVVLLYFLIQVVCIGTLPGLAASDKPLTDAASLFMGRAGASMITLAALLSCAGTVSAILLAGSRLPFAMAEQDALPALLARTHPRFHTPDASILATALIGLAMALSGTFVYALTLASISKLITAIATCAALPLLRRRESAPPAFSAPAGPFLAAVALGLCAWLLASSGWRELRDVGIALALGFLIHASSVRPRRREGVATAEGG
jgi:basic amino acid/polyamine antiporter, APA family